jgi:hypothetical protein
MGFLEFKLLDGTRFPCQFEPKECLVVYLECRAQI